MYRSIFLFADELEIQLTETDIEQLLNLQGNEKILQQLLNIGQQLHPIEQLHKMFPMKDEITYNYH